MDMTITHTVSPELLYVLTRIADSLQDATLLSVSACAPQQAAPAPVTPDPPAATTEPEPEPEPVETPDDQPEQKPALAVVIKPEELRAVAVTKDKAKVKALLDKWEYKSISTVDEADRAEFMSELRGL